MFNVRTIFFVTVKFHRDQKFVQLKLHYDFQLETIGVQVSEFNFVLIKMLFQ